MSKDWYIATDYDQLGPLTINELVDLHKEGKINADTMMWNPDMIDWEEAQSIEEMRALFSFDGGIKKETHPTHPVVLHPTTIQEEEVEWIPSASNLIDLIRDELKETSEPTKEEKKEENIFGLPELFPVPTEPLSIPQRVIPPEEEEKKNSSWAVPLFVIMTLLLIGMVGSVAKVYFDKPAQPVKVVEKVIVEKPVEKIVERVIQQPVQPVKEDTSPVKLTKKVKKKSKRQKVVQQEFPKLSKLTTEDIVAGVKKNADKAGPCIKAARSKNELVPGRHKLILSWIINANGSVTTAKMTGPSSLMGTSIPKCMRKIMRRWKFKPSSDKSQVTHFPFGPFTVR